MMLLYFVPSKIKLVKCSLNKFSCTAGLINSYTYIIRIRILIRKTFNNSWPKFSYIFILKEIVFGACKVVLGVG